MSELTGRALDAEVATQCFGYKVVWINDHRGVGYPYLSGEAAAKYVRDYHKYMADAWLVAEWIRERTGVFVLEWNGFEWEVFYGKDDYNYLPPAKADTPAEAICHAALELKKRLEKGSEGK